MQRLFWFSPMILLAHAMTSSLGLNSSETTRNSSLPESKRQKLDVLWRFDFQHLPVKEEDGVERLVLAGG